MNLYHQVRTGRENSINMGSPKPTANTAYETGPVRMVSDRRSESHAGPAQLIAALGRPASP